MPLERLTAVNDDLKAAIRQHRQGNVLSAVAVYERLSDERPDDARLLRYLGLARFQLGQRQAGLACLCRATEIAPQDAPAWSDLGRMYALHNQHEQARDCFQRAVTADAGYAHAWHNLGVVLRQLGDAPTALNAYKRALAITPDRADSYLGIGNLMVDDNQHENAIESFKRAAQHDPKLGQARASLAAELSGRGEVSEAEFVYRQAIALDPRHHQAWFGLGRTLEDAGHAREAERCYRRVLALQPGHAYALGQLLGLAGAEIEDAVLEAAQKTLAEPTTPEPAKALIGYGLGKALDARKQYARAFAAFRSANSARRAVAGVFDTAEFDARIERLVDTFSPAFFARRRLCGLGTDVPVFIVGMPRSGTTLTEQILHSHPQMFGGGELPYIAQIVAGLQDRFGVAQSWPHCADELSARHINEIAHSYLDNLRRKVPDSALRASDKSPLNFFHLGLIALMFPGARIVHCSRNPIDTCLSIYFENFRPSQTYATALDDVAHYYRGYQRLMLHWRDALPLSMLELRYEDSVADIESQARRLVKFMGLGWDARCLDFHRSKRAVQTPSRWQVRQPIYGSSVQRWRNYESHVGALKRSFPPDMSASE